LAEASGSILPKFYQTRLFFFLMAGLLALTVAPTVIYYEMSYNSVNGTHPQLVTGYRKIGLASATFYVTVHVWSWATSTDTTVNSPSFTLTVDNFPFGTQHPASGTFGTGNYISYTLAFQSNDSSVAYAVGRTNTNHIAIDLSGDVSAGWYHELITRSDSVIWTV
jgi:hypothetical protein